MRQETFDGIIEFVFLWAGYLWACGLPLRVVSFLSETPLEKIKFALVVAVYWRWFLG